MTLSPTAMLERIRRDVALRGVLVSAGATIIALLLLTTIVWYFLVHQLESRVEDTLQRRHKIALSNTDTFTDEERELFQQFRKLLPVRDEGVFAWVDMDGKTLVSNVSGVECRDGFYDKWLDISTPTIGPLAIVPEPQIDPKTHDRFRFLAKRRDERCLVFGRSMFEVDALQASFKRLVIWLVPLCLLPALLVGLAQSLNLRRRLKNLGQVTNALASGELGARMPVDGNDDIDRLAIKSNRAFEKLEDSVNTLKQLTSVVAHDLRAPLSRISIPLEKAIRSNEAGQPDVESLNEVTSGLDDARSIFDALLRISQIESGRRQAKFSSLDLNALAEGLFEIYDPVVEESNRILEFEIVGEGNSHINGDADLIRQALVNLIENAMRYSPEGSTIRVGVLREKHNISLFVRDNGPGLPAEERPKVLQRLYRYEGSTSGKSGHGLGLSLVKAVAELHNGEIVLEDAEPGLMVLMQFGVVGK